MMKWAENMRNMFWTSDEPKSVCEKLCDSALYGKKTRRYKEGVRYNQMFYNISLYI